MTRARLAALLRELAGDPDLLRALAAELEAQDPRQRPQRPRRKRPQLGDMSPEQIARVDAAMARAGIPRPR